MSTIASPNTRETIREKLSSAWQQRLTRWINRRIPPARHIQLGHHNIFIIPNFQGLGFLFFLGLMFIGAVNYESSLAFGFVFWLLSLFILTIFYTYRNLAGLTVSAIPSKAVFAGEKAEITVVLERDSRAHEAISLSFPNSTNVVADLIENSQARERLFVSTEKRGWCKPGRLTLKTIYPFGICQSWSHLDLDIQYLVYPKPVPCNLDQINQLQNSQGNTHARSGNDDFSHFREYQEGDSLRHIAWKIAARGQGLYTKQYISHMDDKIWLRWGMFSGMGTEERLSRLCYCAIQLDANGIAFGLEIPGSSFAPARGDTHFDKVMTALALFE